MKKLTSGLFAAAVMGAMLTGMPSADAAAYPHSQETGCDAYVVGDHDTVGTTKVRAEVTNKTETSGEPKGNVTVTVEKLNGADGDSGSYYTRGGAVIFKFGPLKAGRYVGSMEFAAKDGSKWKDCSSSFSFRVKRA